MPSLQSVPLPRETRRHGPLEKGLLPPTLTASKPDTAQSYSFLNIITTFYHQGILLPSRYNFYFYTGLYEK